MSEQSGPGRPDAPLVEVDLREGYRRWSEVYDTEYNPLIAVEKRMVESMLGRIAFRDALDAGAGTGRWAVRLAEQGAAVTAIDQSPEMLARAVAKAESARLPIRFDDGQLDRLPYADASFDLVLCALVLDHVPDFDPVVCEFARVLRPGGNVIISDFHPEMVAAGGRSVFSHEGVRYRLPNPDHTRHDYLAAVESAGLGLVEVTDLPVEALTSELVKQLFRDLGYGDTNLCLGVLANKAR